MNLISHGASQVRHPNWLDDSLFKASLFVVFKLLTGILRPWKFVLRATKDQKSKRPSLTWKTRSWDKDKQLEGQKCRTSEFSKEDEGINYSELNKIFILLQPLSLRCWAKKLQMSWFIPSIISGNLNNVLM